jgi:coenzyme F420-reducing hydrogenase delta subunit
MDSKSAKRAVEWVSSLFIDSSSTERNSVKVRVRVVRVRCAEVGPNTAITRWPRGVVVVEVAETHSTALFALFESIDRQFLNLQRTVVRESDAQERAGRGIRPQHARP